MYVFVFYDTYAIVFKDSIFHSVRAVGSMSDYDTLFGCLTQMPFFLGGTYLTWLRILNSL